MPAKLQVKVGRHEALADEQGGHSQGVFNPFVQSKLEDIVPAKLQVKVGRHGAVICR